MSKSASFNYPGVTTTALRLESEASQQGARSHQGPRGLMASGRKAMCPESHSLLAVGFLPYRHSCWSHAHCADLFSWPFIHSEMPLCFPHCSHPLQHSKREKERLSRAIAAILEGGAPGKRILFFIEGKMQQVFLLSFQQWSTSKRRRSSAVVFAFSLGSQAFPGSQC